jgi:hypothetical protein
MRKRQRHREQPFSERRKDTIMNVVVRNVAATGLACGLLLAGASLTLAQETGARTSSHVRRVSVVVGANVTLERGGDVGKVVDVILNDNGCAEYVVIRYEDDYIAVPWDVVTVNFDERVVRLDITRERLRDIPTFSRDRWPDFARGEYREKLRKVFGADFERRGRRSEDNAERREERRDERRDPNVERREERRDQRPDRREERRDNREGTRDNPGRDRPSTDRPGRERSDTPADRPGTRPPRDQEPSRNPTDANRAPADRTQPTRPTTPDRPPERN